MTTIVFVCLLSISYLLFAYFCVEKFNRLRITSVPTSTYQPPVSILKPICGLSPEMSENLRSFCEQDYPELQIIFGVQSEIDPAIAIIKKIIEDYPNRDITLVVEQSLHGNNHKVSNLINMLPHAKYGILVIADDDMRVTRDYLNTIIAPLSDNKTGAVTCLYSGSSRGGIVSALNAMFINEWFVPAALISHTLKNNHYCFGATMVIKREILEQIGGLEALVHYLADDYMLGKLVTQKGYKIHLSHFLVENVIKQPDFKSMLLHELRWARTMRTSEPLGYTFTFITDTLMAGCLLAASVFLETHLLMLPVLIVSSVYLVRILFHKRVNTMLNYRHTGTVWLVPVRDILTFLIRLASFTGNRVKWKENYYSVENTGLLYMPVE